MWSLIGSLAFSIFKLFLEKRAGRKLNDQEIIEHSTRYQKERTGNVAKQTESFEEHMEEAHRNLYEKEKSNESTKKKD